MWKWQSRRIRGKRGKRGRRSILCQLDKRRKKRINKRALKSIMISMRMKRKSRTRIYGNRSRWTRIRAENRKGGRMSMIMYWMIK